MEKLNGKVADIAILKNMLVRIVDIMNFDGPLLTLFLNIKNHKAYLFHWVDVDETNNRWLLYQCNASSLDKFLKSEISHLELLMSDERFCYVIDIDDDLNWNSPLIVEKTKLPINYLPKQNIFFDEVDCPNLPRLKEFVLARIQHRRATA